MESFDSVGDYFESKSNWSEALFLLREIILTAPLEECLKWSMPAYTYQGENIIGLAAYKEYVGIWFHQGVFLTDANNVLFNANEKSTKGMRQWRFSNVNEIENQADLISSYVLESIENQKAGKKIKIVRGRELIVPEELQFALDSVKSFSTAFNLFSKAKRVEYANYIAEAKQEKTKLKRIEKITPMVLRGEGLNDKYRSN
ncbi:MAG: YdeI family protein [Crocinitomicaceae bacterium]